MDKEKALALEELKGTEKLAEEAIEKATQKREEEWQDEITVVLLQHAADVTAILSTTEELERVKHEMPMTSDAKNQALNHADDATKIAEIHAEKAELLFAELCCVKALLDSNVEFKSNESTELMKELKFEVEGGAHCTMECHMAGVMRPSSSMAGGCNPDLRSRLKSLLADSQRSKLVNKLSEANQQNRFLKRQLFDGIGIRKSKEVPLYWFGMAESVQVMGSFDGWSEGKQLSPEYTGSFSKFSATLMLRPGSVRCTTIGVAHISPILDVQDKERAPTSVQVNAAHGVLSRLLPSHSSSFDFHIISKEQCGGKACFFITNHPSFGRNGAPEIRIGGSTGVELSAGLHWYLKNLCGAHISWDITGGSQLSSVPNPGFLPRVRATGVLIQRPVPWNYYQNAVSSSYTFAWWNWERWEKEIDWMAIQGINLPLAFTGQEAIWQRVFQTFNISSLDLSDFFGGPAFLAWSRMGNLHGWGGPLPQNWFDQQLSLQRKILERMYELGMTPVLPAFSGNVPAALKTVYPSANITRLGNWFTIRGDSRWCCTYLLDATDPLFAEIGKAFVEMQLKEYGRSSHIYNCDTFDENTPPLDDPEYISTLGAEIFRGIQSGDDDAVWLMQGWLFSYDPFWRPAQMKALLHSVPIGKLVVLDLFAEVKPLWITSEQFYGVPYIWCMLHNFAGNIEMYGILDAIAAGPVEARTSENSTMANICRTEHIGASLRAKLTYDLSMSKNKKKHRYEYSLLKIEYGYLYTKVGVGMSMEGIEQNPVVYDLMSEMAFQHEKIVVKMWIDLYPMRRYGSSDSLIQDAWSILYHSLYNCTDGAYNKNRDVIVAFPDADPFSISLEDVSFNGKHQILTDQVLRLWHVKELTDSYDKPHLWYSTSDVIHALGLLIAGGNEVAESNTYRYDLVDVTRQALAKYANEVFLKVIERYRLSDVHGVTFYTKHFLDLVTDIDTLLACHEGFLLGPWLESSKQLAQTQEQKKQYEWNARTQITMWYDNTEEEASLLRDYGNKYWSGLLRDYYAPRAAIYFKHLLESLETGVGFQLKDWRREWIKLTNDWQNNINSYPVKSTGDALSTSRWLYEKYLRNPDILDH
ncbi:hypothetical protein IFM89_000806 [Coptis chinensis]|uniref:Alpha-N-acetylglucosaminidase n=1 Tax=Coptis chinensis TaxID=261450 RepID=A0A835MBB3_9MAGN|nr:hypothetical protein IFM89_000806 [Coptis chinensis]